MNNSEYIHEAWSIVENGFDPAKQKASESLFSIGNGNMGQRANFEEDYSGKSMQGTYIAGVYYPDKTRVGWWKNGYPEYFAKVLNAPYFTGLHVVIGDELLDLAQWQVISFKRVLDIKRGVLVRTCEVQSPNGKRLAVESMRFMSMIRKDIAAVKFSVKSLNFRDIVSFVPYVDGDVKNQDANYDEKFWQITDMVNEPKQAYLQSKTLKTGFEVGFAMSADLYFNGQKVSAMPERQKSDKKIQTSITWRIGEGDTLSCVNFISVNKSMDFESEMIKQVCLKNVELARSAGFDVLLKEHTEWWANKWETSDIEIEGDVAAQQGIRFNIFQLWQTYTGEDARLNIGPKGFTGEKYGGSTYWDTEAYCVPFYMSTASGEVVRNLLIYRWKQLGKAIENAEKLGFSNGAALYPMVTMNGEECHNEWEITFEEIHRNGAIAYAIYNYVNYTSDVDYLAEYGLEVLIAISRFWAQRVNWSDDKGKYVMLGVTGPNEYENNVNNNWYTNYIATWCLRYTLETIDLVKRINAGRLAAVLEMTAFDALIEVELWKKIIDNIYLPQSKGIFIQQDGFLDKDLTPVSGIPVKQRPINQHWSWDRILRSCYIKQADVLQGLFFFEHEFDLETIHRNYEFYEPLTVHESSLSPCVHSILASLIGKTDDAYQLYLRTSRLDLDDYNHEVHEGLHITSMAGTWMSLVMGFGGLRVNHGRISLNPVLPEKWQSLSFKILFRNRLLKIKVTDNEVDVRRERGEVLTVMINGNEVAI